MPVLWFSIASATGPAAAEGAVETVKERAFHLDDASLPQTAGEADTSVRADSLCKAEVSKTISPADNLCEDAFASGRVPELYRYQYECAFVISPDIGGARVSKNVWLQPASEVAMKRAADRELRKRVCEKAILLTQAQKKIAEDWPAVYRHYVLNDVTVKIYEPSADVPKHRAAPAATGSSGTPGKSMTSVDVSQPGGSETPPIEASVVAGSDQSGTQTGGQGDRNRRNHRGDGKGLRQTRTAGPPYGLRGGRTHPLLRR